MPMGAAGPSSTTVAYSLLGAIKVVEIARQGCFDAGGEDCGPFVEVLVVADGEVGLAKQASCEACVEYAADPLRHASSSRQRAVGRLSKQRDLPAQEPCPGR
jgi:hypothetical protein